jgi:serine/threonine-protein kinase
MAAPRSIGPFEVLEKVGQGGMAQVFKAKAFGASGFEKVVALKTLLPELVGEAEYERMFLEEARLQARLSHRNLLAAHDLGAADGVSWVRLEWVDGGNLAELAREAVVPLELTLLIAEELGAGLSALHRATGDDGRPLGLVHRDVSPTNILVSRDGDVKLADFGVTKATLGRDQTRAGVRKGKYAYMSPEQVSGLPLSFASDQFALGATVAELLTGVRPFERATPLETMDAVRAAQPPELPGVADDVRALVHRLTAKDPKARFGSDAELSSALAAVRSGRPATLATLGQWVGQRLPRPVGLDNY